MRELPHCLLKSKVSRLKLIGSPVKSLYGNVHSTYVICKSDDGIVKSEYGAVKSKYGDLKSDDGPVKSEYGALKSLYVSTGSIRHSWFRGDQRKVGVRKSSLGGEVLLTRSGIADVRLTHMWGIRLERLAKRFGTGPLERSRHRKQLFWKFAIGDGGHFTDGTVSLHGPEVDATEGLACPT